MKRLKRRVLQGFCISLAILMFCSTPMHIMAAEQLPKPYEGRNEYTPEERTALTEEEMTALVSSLQEEYEVEAVEAIESEPQEEVMMFAAMPRGGDTSEADDETTENESKDIDNTFHLYPQIEVNGRKTVATSLYVGGFIEDFDTYESIEYYLEGSEDKYSVSLLDTPAENGDNWSNPQAFSGLETGKVYQFVIEYTVKETEKEDTEKENTEQEENKDDSNEPEKENPDENSDENPNENLDEDPDENSEENQGEDTEENLDENPEENPEEKPEDNPEDTPDDIPDDISEDTPEDTPDDTPDENSDETPEDNPEGNAEDTPENNPPEDNDINEENRLPIKYSVPFCLYEVQRGDRPRNIAKTFGISTGDLLLDNKIAGRNPLAGSVLFILNLDTITLMKYGEHRFTDGD